MQPEVQLEVMRRLVKMGGEPALEVPKNSTRVPVNIYIDPSEFEKEKKALFRRQPVIVAHVSEIPEPGDFVTETVADVPLIVLRDTDGEVRVFMNVCRHRGARLLDESEGKCKKALVCPYHAWSYRLDGSLINIPNEEFFGDLDHAELGLRKVQHAVRHGFVWAQIDATGDGELDIADGLGPTLDDDFDGFSLATHHVARKVVSTRVANWKLVMDAFAEGYHVKALHRTSLARFFLNGQITDDCAPHVRQIGIRKSLMEIADTPEDWDFRRDTTAFYNIFPNGVLVLHPNWISQMSIMPEGVDGVRVVHRMLSPMPLAEDPERERLEKSFTHIQNEVFEKEDLYIAQNVQSALHSGANEHVLAGGLEEGMRLFHLARVRAIADAS